MRTAVLLCALLWSLVDSQTAPYVRFNEVDLPNHGYVDLSLVGVAEDGGDSVQCHTNLATCCTGAEGNIPSADRPDWHFPNGNGVGFSSGSDDIYMYRGAQRNDLRRRNNALSPSGIYRCEIPIDDGDGDPNTFVRETVYVGIYSSGGGAVTISGGVEFAMISDDEFTLTCTSTGGPATTVTWTRDSQTAVGERRSEVVNGETAEYTNTLTVTGRLPGLYTCTVTNDVTPDGASVSITVQVTSAPTNVMAVQEGPDGIRVTWTPSSGATGYIISYDNGAGSETVDGGSTDSHTLMDLLNGATYTISIVATSETSFPSDSVAADMTVSLVPDQPSINTNPPTTATSISLSWSVDDSEVTSSVVSWQRDTSGECPDVDRGSTPVTGSSTSTTITGREEDSSYFITVTVFNDAGSSEESNTVIAETKEAAPSAAPTDVSATSTSTTITVQWGPVECIHRNGDITGYLVQYGIQGQSTQTMSAPGDSSGGSYEITGLQSSTTYSIRVAAITGVTRVGEYSSSITEDTSVSLSVTSIVSSSSTTLVISWTLDDGVMVESYTISYSNTDTDCFTDSDIITGIDGSTMSHELSGLKEGTEYSVTVTAQLASGETVADMQTAITSATTPSAAPISVSVSVVNSTAITVQWEMVPCIHRNGDITGYSVRYTGDGSAQNTFVIGGGATMTTISDLRSSAAYVIEVAVVNSDGTGVYSAPQIVVPGQPSVSVTSIAATSISLSWSVPSDSVVTSYMYEVMWRETDGGATEMTSDSLTDTSYTIEQLDSTTIYTITVTATNQAGNSTDSLPVIISTGSTITDSCTEESSDDSTVITGGVVVTVVILSLSVAAIVIVLVIVSRNRKGRYTTGHKRGPTDTTNRSLGLSKLSDEAAYADPDVIRTSSNEAYHTVSQTGGTTTDYETVSDPHTVPPSTSHSSQPPTTGDYEQV